MADSSPARRDAPTGARSGDAGVSLIEMLVALFVFALVSAGALATIDRGLGLARTNGQRVVAANFASEHLGQLRTVDPQRIPVSPATVTVDKTVDTTTYTLTQTVRWVSEEVSGDACDGNVSGSGSRRAYLRVDLAVSWSGMGGVGPVRSTSLINPPVTAPTAPTGTAGGETGAILVTVLDRDGQPAPERTVTVSGSEGLRQQATNGEGCAYFAALPPGSYMAQLPGYVDSSGTSPPKRAIEVVANPLPVQWQLAADLGMTLNLTFRQRSNLDTVPTDLPIRVDNLKVGQLLYPGSGPARALTPLYPDRAGYYAWAGSCSDADPGASSRGPALAADPGGSANGQVALAAVTITSRPGVTVRATHAPDAGCPAGSTYSVATGSAGTARLALPYGTWSLSAGGGVPSSVTLTPASPEAAVSLP